MPVDHVARVRAELARYGRLILSPDDAARAIAGDPEVQRAAGPSLSGRVAFWLSAGDAYLSRHLDPEVTPPWREREGHSPVRAALAMFADRYRTPDAAVETLYRSWAADLAGKPWPDLVRAVADRLADPARRDLTSGLLTAEAQPTPDVLEEKVAGAIREYFPEVALVTDTARRYAAGNAALLFCGEGQLVRALAARLAEDGVIGPKDPRLVDDVRRAPTDADREAVAALGVGRI